jgi:hypothetical protein
MNTNEFLNIATDSNGSVLVDNAFVAHVSNDIVCVTVQLTTKYAKICSYGKDECPIVYLYADTNPLNTNLLASLDEPTVTVLKFPDLTGWNIFSISNPGRDSFNMTLVKKP